MESIFTIEKGVFKIKTSSIGIWKELQRIAYTYYEYQRLVERSSPSL
jgi:hypothetical protein